jgi:hypothetical protein
MLKAKKTKAPQRRRARVGVSTLVYRGSIQGPRSPNSGLHTVTLHFIAQISSTVGGVIASVWGDSPAAVANWSSLAATFREYRTLGFSVRYLPVNRYNKVTTTCIPMFSVQDRSSATALASRNEASEYDSVKMHSLEDPFSDSIRMSGLPDAEFTATSSPASTYYTKWYVDGLTVSTTYGYALVTYRVQFRTLGI